LAYTSQFNLLVDIHRLIDSEHFHINVVFSLTSK